MPSRQTLVETTRQLFQQANKDDVAGLAGEIAFRTFLELFPLFIFLALLGSGLQNVLHVDNPVHQMLGLLESSLPQGAADSIRQQLETVLSSEHAGISLGVLGVLWLFAGSGAALLKAMNRVYEIEETRPFWERYVVGLWLTILAGSVLVVAIAVMSFGQIVSRQAGGDGSWVPGVLGVLRWPALVLVLCAECTVVYRVAPNAKPAWRFITPGALLFVGGWLLASTIFVIYVDKSGGYSQTYGALGGVVVMMLWLQITAYALLLGAELNDLLEHPSAAEQPQHVGRASSERKVA
ncbi:MAG: YihY/virulence factor BrkB family protein [Chloroflexi bacterium]|nr:YihY/virulence factor BrkB family protein [Chloroflexota bacterium]